MFDFRGPCGTLAVAASLLLVPIAAGSPQPSFQGLGDLPGGRFYSWANAVSADGTTVVGHSDAGSVQGAFRWTASTGMVQLIGASPDITSIWGLAVSGDGSVVAGVGRYPGIAQGGPIRWTEATGVTGLFPTINGEARGISRDGITIVGESISPSFVNGQAFRWTQSEGRVGLGDLPGGRVDSFARGISADGKVIVGYSYSANGKEAFRWTEADGMLPLGDLAGGGFESWAHGVSADGAIVVGSSFSESSATPLHTFSEAFRWTGSGGMVGLGDLPGGEFESAAYAISDDGRIVVGASMTGFSLELDRRAFIWDETHGMRDLDALLRDSGVLPPGWTLLSATGLSADGTVIVGSGINHNGNREAWIAVIPEPATLLGVGLLATMLAARRHNVGCCMSDSTRS